LFLPVETTLSRLLYAADPPKRWVETIRQPGVTDGWAGGAAATDSAATTNPATVATPDRCAPIIEGLPLHEDLPARGL
jgi:hypothetical protein